MRRGHSAGGATLVFAAAVVARGSAQGQTLVPIGSELQVNTSAAGLQGFADVAASPSGGALAAWQDGAYVRAAHLAGGTTPVDEIVVNEAAASIDSAYFVSVASVGTDDYVVAWVEDLTPGSFHPERGVVRRLSNGGLGSEIEIDAHVDGEGIAVAGNGTDRFAAAWGRTECLGYGCPSIGAVLTRVFDLNGNPLGPPALPSGIRFGLYPEPGVAAAPDGTFLVAWGQLPGGVRRLGPTGGLRAPRLRFSAREGTNLAVSPDGRFTLVEWGGGIYARTYTSSGAPIGGQTRVDTLDPSDVYVDIPSDVAARADGVRLVTWASNGSGGSDDSGYSAQGRLLDASGRPVGAQLQLNELTTGEQRLPRVTTLADQTFLVVWQSAASTGGDQDGLSVQARRFAVVP